MRKKFLTAYDYQSGGIWQYIYADSEEQIIKKYPALVVVDKIPDWLSKLFEETDFKLSEYDIEDQDDALEGFRHT